MLRFGLTVRISVHNVSTLYMQRYNWRSMRMPVSYIGSERCAASVPNSRLLQRFLIDAHICANS